MAETSGRDRLRELLDAVLDEEHRSLDDMAGGAYSSPYHFTRRLSPRGRRAAGRDAPPGDARAGRVAAAARRLGHRRGVRGRLRVGRGVQPCLSPGLRAPAEPARRVRGEPQHLAARAQRHPLPPAHVAVGPHRGAHHEPADRPAGPPRPRRHPRPARPRQAAARRRLPRDGPARPAGAVASTAPTSRSPPSSTHQVAHQGDLAGRDRGRGLPGARTRRPRRAARPARRGRAAAGWRWCGTSSGATRGTTGSSTRSATRRRASCSAASSPTCSPSAPHRRQLARTMLREHGLTVDDGDPITWLRRRNGQERMSTLFYTATTLDGFLADEHDSLDWLFKQHAGRGRRAVLRRVHRGRRRDLPWAPRRTSGCSTTSREPWPYDAAELGLHAPRPAGAADADVRFVAGRRRRRCTPRWSPRPAARTCGSSAGATWPRSSREAGLLDGCCCRSRRSRSAPADRSSRGRFDLRLVDVQRNGAFLAATYDVVGPTGTIGA